MRHIRWFIPLALMLILIAAGHVLAQTETPTPAPIPTPVPPATAADINELVQEAEEKLDRAFDLLGLFEAIGLVVSLIFAVVGVAGPVVTGYFARIVQRANNEVQQAREELDKTRLEIEAQLRATESLQSTSRALEAALIEASDEFRKASEQLEMRVQGALNRLESQMTQNREELAKLRHDLETNAEVERERTTKALQGQSLQSLAERQYQETDFEGAIATYQRALDLDDRNPITHYRLGYVYVHSDILDLAEEQLEHALEIEPELPQALATLGYVYRRQAEELAMGPERIEKFNLAEAKLLEALRISPRLIDDDGESWWGSLGGLYRRQGQVDQAIYAYEQAAKVTPRSSYPFSNLALLFMAKRDRTAMLQTYEKVEQLALTESQAEANNYWAFGDLLTSRLALGKVELADATLASLFYTTPAGSTYSLELVVGTLERLMEALGGPQEAPHIPPYIQQIREHIERYQPSSASYEQ